MLLELGLVIGLSSTKAVGPLWEWGCENMSQYKMFVAGFFLSQVVGYFLGCLPYVLLDAFQLSQFSSFKIQSENYPSGMQAWKSVKDMMVSFVTVVLPMLVMGGQFLPMLGITREGPIPPWYNIAVQVAFFFVVEDYLNYWIHRLLHLPWLYKHVHSVHHTYDAPFGIVAAYAHPAEVIALAIPTFAGPVLVSPHLYTLLLWQLFRNLEAIDIHSGYELPYSLMTILPAYAGARHHDYHHYMHSGNFASVFTWCDKIYGTDLGYKSYKEKRKQE